MQLPVTFLGSIAGVPGFNREAFVAAHTAGALATSIRINPAKVVNGEWSMVNDLSSQNFTHHAPFTLHKKVPWSQYGYYLAQRPSFTFDPFFHAGCYYVQEASSMFLEQALHQTVDTSQPLKVLDLCAAPGGKSTHLQSLLSPESLLVSNEVIRNRAAVLVDNMMKWGCSNAVVTNNDPSSFKKLPAFFDVMVVDAPCSGSGLFRKDRDAINEWSENNVALCQQRQQRILADALPALKEGGILIYSTCSYSAEEDEAIADWLVAEQGMSSLPLKLNEGWGVIETASPNNGASGYRFFPDKVEGEGFYLACFRKESGEEPNKYKAAKWEAATAKEKKSMEGWVHDKETEGVKLFSKLFLLPKSLLEQTAVVKAALNVQYAGVLAGESFHEKFVPAHALALSSYLADRVPRTDVVYGQAISYLQRNELKIETVVKGWQVLRYERHNLGWINALSNRVNNYYPKELRILKRDNDAPFEK